MGRKSTKVDKICVGCNRSFRGYLVAKYCTKNCFNNTKTTQAAVTFDCAHCSNTVTIKRSRYELNGYRGKVAKYCSRTCSGKSRRDRSWLECIVCAQQFEAVPSKIGAGQVHCSIECRKVSEKANSLPEAQLRENMYFARMKKQLGLSREEWQALYDKHDGNCHICGKPETVIHLGRIKKLDVDHCHLTGKVRGFLCTKHNALLGYAQDNIETLKSAIRYLEDNAE